MRVLAASLHRLLARRWVERGAPPAPLLLFLLQRLQLSPATVRPPRQLLRPLLLQLLNQAQEPGQEQARVQQAVMLPLHLQLRATW